MSKEVAQETVPEVSDDAMMSPFAGGDPIESEDLGTMTDLVENADAGAGRFQQITPDEGRTTDINPAQYESAPTLSDAAEETTDEADAPEETAEAEEPAAETTDEAETPEDLEDAGEPTQKAEETPQKEPIRIPKYRLDQEAAKRRAAEEKVKQLEEMLNNAAPVTDAPELDFDIADSVKAAFDKVLDGDLDNATQAIVDVITSTNKQVLEAARADAAKQATAITNQTAQKTELDQVIDRLETTYDVFNQESDNYNQDLVQEVLAMQAGYRASGMTDAQAMEKAANNALVLYGFAEFEGDAPEQTEAPAAETKTAPSQQVRKNVEASKQQPPDLPPSSSREERTPEIDIMQLSEEEFDALPEATLRRLRGDSL